MLQINVEQELQKSESDIQNNIVSDIEAEFATYPNSNELPILNIDKENKNNCIYCQKSFISMLSLQYHMEYSHQSEIQGH